MANTIESKTIVGESYSSTNEKIFDFGWQLKKRGLADITIKQRIYRLQQLVKRGADLMNPDSISTIIALSNWTESNKRIYIVTYKSFTKIFKLEWEAPKTRVE